MTIYVPYTYVITHLPSGKRYYGVRHGTGCHPSDLWVKYFTSSKVVKKLIEKDGKDVFRAEVRQTFASKDEAVKWETKFITRTQIWRPDRQDWLNRCYRFNPLTGRKRPLVGSKISRILKERWKDPEFRAEMLAIRPVLTEETRKKMSKPRSKAACTYCGTIASGGMMIRWHGENCKENPANANKPPRTSGCKGIKHTAEARARMSAGVRANRATCGHCGMVSSKAMISRYHGDNCKHKPVPIQPDER